MNQYPHLISPVSAPAAEEPGFVAIGMDAIYSVGRAIHTLIISFVTGLHFLIIKLPVYLVTLLGFAVVAVLGAVATRKGYVLMWVRTQRAAYAASRQIMTAQRALWRTVRNITIATKKNIQARVVLIQDKNTQRRVQRTLDEYQRESTHIKALHAQLDLLKIKKRELEFILDDLLEDAAPVVKKDKVDDITRRGNDDFTGGYRS